MASTCRFIIGLHSHQPVGNFDHVFEDAYQRSYLPFLKVLFRHPSIHVSLHFSGVLLEWMEAHHPESFDLLRTLVSNRQVEMMGGGMEEPILVMLPERDRIGQLTKMRKYLSDHFGVSAQGCWLAERVWEQGLVTPVVQSGYRYIPVDDSHFRYAGLSRANMAGYYITEDQGNTLAIFPMDEYLRYIIPFAPVEKTIEYLRQQAQTEGSPVVTYAADGEKFGIWPGTYKLVYAEGWLEKFFAALEENADWLKTVTFSEALDDVQSIGKVFLPDASYREMMEWVLPSQSLQEYEDLVKELKEKGQYDRARYFLKGGFWRGFRAKYPESNEMYSKMMLVSEKVKALGERNGTLEAARNELYRGQCNCPYWHGIFGGLYLPHLRHAIYTSLIRAENIADAELTTRKSWVNAEARDYNFDGFPEVLLTSDVLNAYILPHYGGHLCELDYRPKALNLTAGLSRRMEAYHRRVLEHVQGGTSDVQSIHDAVHFKSEGLDQLLHYDRYKHDTLTDHVLADNVTLAEFAQCRHTECGDFVTGAYQYEIQSGRNRRSVLLTRDGRVTLNGRTSPLKLTKEVELASKNAALAVGYELINTGTRPLEFTFAVEFVFALLAGHAPDRYLYVENPENNLGDLSTRVDLDAVRRFGLVDAWQGLDARLQWTVPARVWTFPIETVSQSEGGFESVYQSTIVLPRWQVKLDVGQRWALHITETPAELGSERT